MSTAQTAIYQLGIKGFGKPEALAESLALSEAEVGSLLADLEKQGLTSPTRIGPRLSADGKAVFEKLIAVARDAVDMSRLEAEHDTFSALNYAFKKLVTDWQMREVAGELKPNDHSDATYDSAVVDRLVDLHPRISDLLTQMSGHVPHMNEYVRRFDAALTRFRGGDLKYLTAPIIDSYHTVWFELHQDIIRLLGRSRADEAAAGRAV